ncbi:MAG TPA: Rrf2 family transcriptional regulator [Candidatus Krumholzibacteria bacterium]|nr:Rrf2 family transcriptional regulator [Candidatus Krumholzibacteria bacterium]
MIHSTACEYAIRAMTYLARFEKGQRVLARDVSAHEKIPGPFLGKIFQTLVRGGLLTSTKGPGGGFALARSPREIALFDIYQAVDGTTYLDACAVGLARCSDETPCPLHDRWKPIRERIRQYLQATSLSDMADATEKKLAALPPKER